ncbi:MAG: RHS repeat-associated core domain-containing protein, partial [Reichenbachiella sp.]
KTKTGQVLTWDYQNMLQTTTTAQADGSTLAEYNTYAKAGQRNCKVTEKKDQDSNTTEITESLYLSNLEYRTIWKGENLSYDGETVTEQSTGAMVIPHEQYSTLRIRQGHKQVAQKRVYQYKEGIKVPDQTTSYSLDNNIDSCELTLGGNGHLESYESYKPYGETAISYGKTGQQPYKYSGQEKDESGLYYYGYRSLDPDTFRWISPDPAGLQGSGLNWYAMVKGNPVTMRDEYGLGPFDKLPKKLLKPALLGLLATSTALYNKNKLSEKWYGNDFTAIGEYGELWEPISTKVHDMDSWKHQLERHKVKCCNGKASAFQRYGFDAIQFFAPDEEIPEDPDRLKQELKNRLSKFLLNNNLLDSNSEKLILYGDLTKKVGIGGPDVHMDATSYPFHQGKTPNDKSKYLTFISDKTLKTDQIVNVYNIWLVNKNQKGRINPNLAFLSKDTLDPKKDVDLDSFMLIRKESHKFFSKPGIASGWGYVFYTGKTFHFSAFNKNLKENRNTSIVRFAQYRVHNNFQKTDHVEKLNKTKE